MSLSPLPRAIFTLHGQVTPGKQLGSRLGFPTANIAYDGHGDHRPADGVYVAVATVEDEPRAYVAVVNQGKHPTAPDGPPTVEAHLIGYPAQPLYGRRLTLAYMAFIRPEQRFEHLEALRQQLQKDCETAMQWAHLHAPTLADHPS